MTCSVSVMNCTALRRRTEFFLLIMMMVALTSSLPSTVRRCKRCSSVCFPTSLMASPPFGRSSSSSGSSSSSSSSGVRSGSSGGSSRTSSSGSSSGKDTQGSNARLTVPAGDAYSEYMMITSATNEKVKLLKSLSVKKKRDDEGKVLLEGHRQVIDAIRGGLLPSVLMFSDESTASPLGSQLMEMAALCPPSAVLRSTDAIIQSISDTVHSQGVVAAFPKPTTGSGSLLPTVPPPYAPLIILLDRPSDPGNCGTIIRTAYGLGADAIIVAEGCDVWSPKVLRSAMGMCLKLPIFETSWAAIPQLLADSYGPIQVLLADADPTAPVYHTVDMSQPTVIVIGSEATGIGPESMRLLHAQKIRIPTAINRDLESFNAAVACSILLGEIGRQRGSK